MSKHPSKTSQHHAIFAGNVVHKRYTPKDHRFNSTLFMLAFDVEEIQNTLQSTGLFGFNWYHPLRFVEKDYIKSEPGLLLTRIKDKVRNLNGHEDIKRILMLVQVRCFGLYFSPVNFYFCYDNDNQCTQMLAEVSNTPWNERHYYLVDLLEKEKPLTSKKVFQVSPFMDLDMHYIWHIKAPNLHGDRVLVKIENKRVDASSGAQNKIFEASLLLKKQEFNKRNLFKIWTQLPVMTGKIVVSIYWQALKLFIKRIPFIGYQTIN
jgi:uncharacterized protein